MRSWEWSGEMSPTAGSLMGVGMTETSPPPTDIWASTPRDVPLALALLKVKPGAVGSHHAAGMRTVRELS